jgi:hypothetical protein
MTDEAPTPLEAIAHLLASLPAFCPHRRYVLERVDGELVFRQPEIDAIIEAALDDGPQPQVSSVRRIIKPP